MRPVPLILFLSMCATAFAQAQPCVPEPASHDARTPDARVKLVSPTPGRIFHPGQRVDMVVDLAPPLTKYSTVTVALAGLGHYPAPWVSGLRFSTSVSIPPGVSGPVTISPDFTDTSGNFLVGPSVIVGIKPREPLVSVTLLEHHFFISPQSSGATLYLRGTYANHSEADLSSCLLGTTYKTSNPSVATVTGNGEVKVVAAGVATITVTNGALADFALLLIEDAAKPLAPIDLTKKVTIFRSELRFDRNTRHYVQDVAIANTSGEMLPPRLVLLLSGLPERVALVNEAGRTSALQPLRSPYLEVKLPGQGLSMRPGSSIAFALQFNSPDWKSIDYSLRLYRIGPEDP